MATFTFNLLTALLVCLASLSLITGSQSEDSNNAQADSAPSRLASSSLAHILRRRSAELQAPPHIYASRLASYLRPAPSKRDSDGYWIWMPAHGYMSVPRDEVISSSGDKDSVGNLLRYGRK